MFWGSRCAGTEKKWPREVQTSYIAFFVSGPPGPSKSRALVGLARNQLCLNPSISPCSGPTYWPDPPFSPGLEIRSPPSSTGISRLSPAPDAAEPTVMVLPGNLSVTLVSTPDSVAGRFQLSEEGRGRGGEAFTRVCSADTVFGLM